MRITSQNELIFPMPAKWRSTARVSLFLDQGNVFNTNKNLIFFGPNQASVQNYNFSLAQIKRSAGISVQWLAPLGLFRFSLGMPLNAKHGDSTGQDRFYGDETEVFQFSIGQAF